ncbi:hypothetical protein [Gymnodinialimonas hymeniacidonis]|uniref:hypothetical protein n=1 Tax=Gymnodinialimonas hymeniacidonis TaxID=3126508 RepID=UPI0034C5BB14
MAGLVLWAALWFGGSFVFNTSRSISYDTGAPRNWPVLYDLHLNGADMIPWGFEIADWTGDTSYASGGTISGSIPRRSLFNRSEIEVDVRWMEWATGQAWTAQMVIDHPEDLRAGITFHFAADGQLSVYRPNAALRAGGLGRQATHDDYERLARVCGTALPENSALFAELADARANNVGIDTARIPASPPPPPPSDCTEPSQ